MAATIRFSWGLCSETGYLRYYIRLRIEKQRKRNSVTAMLEDFIFSKTPQQSGGQRPSCPFGKERGYNRIITTGGDVHLMAHFNVVSMFRTPAAVSPFFHMPSRLLLNGTQRKLLQLRCLRA
jgi:hypothetical protein